MDQHKRPYNRQKSAQTAAVQPLVRTQSFSTMLALLPLAACVSSTRHTWEKRGGDYICCCMYKRPREMKSGCTVVWVHSSVGAGKQVVACRDGLREAPSVHCYLGNSGRCSPTLCCHFSSTQHARASPSNLHPRRRDCEVVCPT